MSHAALEVSGLSVVYPDGGRVLRGVNLSLGVGECLAVVGESGCGKSTLVRAVLGLLPNGTAVEGSISVEGVTVTGLGEGAMRMLRGRRIGYIPQDPASGFNPLHPVVHHVREAWRVHGAPVSRASVASALERLGIDGASARGGQRPHQWSGGMLQRASIVAAGAHEPPVVIADEPTSALDADRAHAVLTAVRGAGSSVLLVSHDLSLVAEHADRVAVIYAGEIIELGAAAEVLAQPRHPYTQALLAAVPRPGCGLPEPLLGAPPDPRMERAGCAFVDRCPCCEGDCGAAVPDLRDGVACWHVGTEGHA